MVVVVVVGMLLLLNSKARQETEVSPVVASVLFCLPLLFVDELISSLSIRTLLDQSVMKP